MSLLTLGHGWRAVGNGGGRQPVTVADVNWPISPYDTPLSYVPTNEDQSFLDRVDWPNVLVGALVAAVGFFVVKRFV